jgi:hypothetical protein
VSQRPFPPGNEPLSDDERELALRLAKLDAAAGPSAALDARILGMARTAAAPTRPVRRWPGAVGVAAVLVAAVGLAWQLRPMFQLPPPSIGSSEHAGDAGRAGANRETVVQIETVPRAPAPVADVGDQAASVASATAQRKATPAVGGSAVRRAPARQVAARPHSPEFVDEALPAADATAAAPMPTTVAAPAPAAAAQESMRMAPEARGGGVAMPQRHAAVATVSDIDADTRLPARAWLARIRERRDAGDLAGARASLARFVISHRTTRVPADLRPLLHDDDPWSP